ncbi:replicase, partial [Bifidobacterium longum subsp. longum]
MSEEYSQPTLELSRTFEGWWLPERPLCCDDDYSQLHRRSRADALKCKHVETNPAALVNTIVVDIDDEEARAIALWEHEACGRTGSRRTPTRARSRGWV